MTLVILTILVLAYVLIATVLPWLSLPERWDGCYMCALVWTS